MTKTVTNQAIYTVLRCLGMTRNLAYDAMFYHAQRLVPFSHITDFENIRRHEIAFIYPKIYRQNKYLGE